MAESLQDVTHARVLRIAVPIVISNATVPLLGAVDTAVVGQMGAAVPIGAVGIGAIILTSIYWIFGFLRMGTVGLASQALGASDTGEMHAILSRCLLIGLGAGVMLIALQIPLFYLAFLISPASAEVEVLARDYMAVRIWSAPALIAMYGVTGWLIAQERTGAVLIIQLATNGLNAALNIWFVLGLEMGVTGVAWATFLAEWIGLTIGLWMCRGVFGLRHWRDVTKVFAAAPLARMAQINRDIMLRSMLLQTMFLSLVFFSGDLGNVTLAANQVLLQFLHITAHALDGFAFTAESLVGQAVGQRNAARIRRAALLSCGWGLVIAAIIALMFWVFGTQIVAIMTNATDVRGMAADYLIYLIIAPLAGVAAWMLDGVFIGATRARDMRNMMAISAIVYAAAVATLVPLFGNHGLWVALLISFVARGITLGLRYPALERDAQG